MSEADGANFGAYSHHVFQKPGSVLRLTPAIEQDMQGSTGHQLVEDGCQIINLDEPLFRDCR